MPDEVSRRRRARSAERWAALSLQRGAGLRAPVAGGRDRVEIGRLEGVKDAPREVARDDQFEAGLAMVIGRLRVQTTV